TVGRDKAGSEVLPPGADRRAGQRRLVRREAAHGRGGPIRLLADPDCAVCGPCAATPRLFEVPLVTFSASCPPSAAKGRKSRHRETLGSGACPVRRSGSPTSGGLHGTFGPGGDTAGTGSLFTCLPETRSSSPSPSPLPSAT